MPVGFETIEAWFLLQAELSFIVEQSHIIEKGDSQIANTTQFLSFEKDRILVESIKTLMVIYNSCEQKMWALSVLDPLLPFAPYLPMDDYDAKIVLRPKSTGFTSRHQHAAQISGPAYRHPPTARKYPYHQYS